MSPWRIKRLRDASHQEGMGHLPMCAEVQVQFSQMSCASIGRCSLWYAQLPFLMRIMHSRNSGSATHEVLESDEDLGSGDMLAAADCTPTA